ncbi:exported protein of unknown function [uncultured Sphingopyxis sp.]|uniref:Crotonobetainyl-CoA:carnitine CoA-transferase CaiB-like acyl-CoA transferase n=2 Tax=Sphingopyxis TaxID=165697 RepID=A0A7W9B8I9_9SPHN|nr:crotonobetainyl-CoA:carnitine CoA-transferase CaiB-like acyl-CoA transferase [Sphingopyxis panaciterrulae]SBV32573.1 exported protein of unknown function [uncultured Sphingopyxis sp.]
MKISNISVHAFVWAAAFGTTAAHAQSAPAAEVPPAEAVQDAGDGDIIVSAQRREERLQDVPIAISAFSGDALQSAGISSTNDLTQITPSLNFTQSSFSPQPTIRGLGTRGVSAGDESLVPVYIDGVYQPFLGSVATELNNIARVEVLKGPQSALFGLDYDSLKAFNPGIIVVDSSAFGPTGPWSRRMGYGPLVRASSGLTMQWRYPGEADSFSDAITVYPDHVAARIGAIATLALLVRRLRTGIGGSIAISQSEVMLSHMAAKIARRVLERAGVAVTGEEAEGASALYRCAGDDEWCVVSLRGEADRQAMLSVTGGEEIGAWLAEQDPRAAMEALQAAGVPAGAMLRVSELPEFDYYVERGSFRSVTHPHRGEPHFAETAPVRSLRMPAPPEVPAPLPGEHTAEIVRDILGLDDARIDQLIAQGALEQFIMPEDAA